MWRQHTSAKSPLIQPRPGSARALIWPRKPRSEASRPCRSRRVSSSGAGVVSIDAVDLTGFQNLSGLPGQRVSNLLNAYAKAINQAYQRTGALFQRPFGRIAVNSDAYFLRVVAYIHQNPQKHGLVADFRTWPYSSYGALLSNQPTRLTRNEVLEWFGGSGQFEAFHAQSIGGPDVVALVPEDFD